MKLHVLLAWAGVCSLALALPHSAQKTSTTRISQLTTRTLDFSTVGVKYGVSNGAPCTPATSMDLGSSGCPASGQGVFLYVSPPVPGEDATFVVTSPYPNTKIFVLAGPAASTPYLLFGCKSYIDLANLFRVIVGVTDDHGNFSSTIPVPNNPALQGQALVVQALIWLGTGDKLSNGQGVTFGCPPDECVASGSITSNFNGTPIPAGTTVWLNAVVKIKNTNCVATTAHFTNASVSLAGSIVPVPDATIVFSPSVTTAVTTFDVGSNQWITSVPVGYSGNVFLSGLALPAPAGLPKGISPVIWSGDFSSDCAGVSFQWKWAAGVYTTFTTILNDIGVKPIDGSPGSLYANSDHAGTPENFKAFVTGGARGGGGSNFTGSYSGTETPVCE